MYKESVPPSDDGLDQPCLTNVDVFCKAMPRDSYTSKLGPSTPPQLPVQESALHNRHLHSTSPTPHLFLLLDSPGVAFLSTHVFSPCSA